MDFLIQSLKALTEPVGFFWFALLLVCVWQGIKKRRKAFLPLLGLVFFLWLIGATPLTWHLVASLERPYAGTDVKELEPGDAVIVLGGNLMPSKHDPLGFSISDAGDRVLAGLELMRQGKASTLILGGAVDEETGAGEAKLLQDWITTWKLRSPSVIALPANKTTYDEAQNCKKLALQRQFGRTYLVSSAWHLKRAEALFKKIKMNVIPIGCDFEGLPRVEHPGSKFLIVPEHDQFKLLRLYLHEVIGWYYYKYKDWI